MTKLSSRPARPAYRKRVNDTGSAFVSELSPLDGLPEGLPVGEDVGCEVGWIDISRNFSMARMLDEGYQSTQPGEVCNYPDAILVECLI
jgi:hypothetical protein